MAVQILKELLARENVKYVSLYHAPAYTAQEIAARVRIPGRQLAKTVIVRVDGKLAMAVLAASDRVDFALLKQGTGARKIDLVREEEFAFRFPACEVGAMPPFGNLYGLEVFVASSFAENENISFNAGSHSELIRLAYKDFERLVRPKVLEFSRPICPKGSHRPFGKVDLPGHPGDERTPAP
jgi:Ala-tRNA(Pro) deacylase